jgi:hypothetical protein
VNGDFQVQMNRTRVEKLQRLLPTEEVEITNILDENTALADKRLKERLPLISCECGTEILVVPDLQAMNRAIKTHVTEHRKKIRNTKNNKTTSSKISKLLSQLILIKLSEQNDT